MTVHGCIQLWSSKNIFALCYRQLIQQFLGRRTYRCVQTADDHKAKPLASGERKTGCMVTLYTVSWLVTLYTVSWLVTLNTVSWLVTLYTVSWLVTLYAVPLSLSSTSIWLFFFFFLLFSLSFLLQITFSKL